MKVSPVAKRTKVSASREPGGLIVHISGLLPSLSPAEQRVGRLVVADPADAARRTITDRTCTRPWPPLRC